MNSVRSSYRLKYAGAITILFTFLLSTVSMVQASVNIFTNQAEWESNVTDINVFTTSADNILKANEVFSIPGNDETLGQVLNFPSANTGLSVGFKVETIESGAEFLFNDNIGSGSSDDWLDAISVGDSDIHGDDDWSLTLLNGATMTAFGVEIRNSRNLIGETLTIYLMSSNAVVAALDLSAVPNDAHNLFLGIVSDVAFDSIIFDENPDDDDIAIADFRFASIGYKCAIEPKEGRIIVELGTPFICGPTEVDPNCLGQSGPFDLDPSIPAGTYAVTLQSYDNHTAKSPQPQSIERYFLRLNLADGNMVETRAIRDLPDGTGNDNLIELVNTTLGVNAHIDSIQAIHYCDESTGNICDDLTPNSILPVCVAFDLVQKRCDHDFKDGYYGKDDCDGKDWCYNHDGHDGYDCKDGYDGHDGYDGKDGYSGYGGYDGHDGYDGKDGYSGYGDYDGHDGYDGKDGYSGYGDYDGHDGYDGKDGYSGYGDYDGHDGYDGKDGYSGYGGYDGYDGYDSKDGYSGYRR